MRWLLILLIVFLTLSSVFAWDPGPAPGVNVKNAILYLLAMGLVFRVVFERRFKLQLPAIHIAFALLIGCAVLSYIVVVLAVDYPRYNVLRSAFDLKNRPVDQMLFFMVFFYGARSREDALLLLKVLLGAWLVSHAVAILDAAGVVQFGDIERREDGRVQGTVGESNQYGAFVALTLPAIAAAAFASRGFMRWVWFAAAMMTLAALLMTVSRGAFVAVTFATLAGAWMFRRFLSAGRIALWAGGAALVLLVLGVVLAAGGYGELLYQRVIAGSSGDLGGTSSGRTEIWSTAIGMMVQHPLTLLTGFGWNSYWSMPFRYSPHNYYLSQWFNLGLPGLICSIALIALPIRAARNAALAAPPQLRLLLAGFVIAALAFAAATFFVDLYTPWLYFWAYAGVAMRIALSVSETAPAAAPSAVQRTRGADAFGWAVAPRHQ